MTLGEQIRKARGKLGISQETLAHSIGVSVATVYRIEKTNVVDSVTVAKALAKELRVPLDLDGFVLAEKRSGQR